ncbi:MAG: AraC family transcriptional regulator, partial [Methylibium sp.]|nr:AraC family transcriptional regulator [Methylibium sp.]
MPRPASPRTKPASTSVGPLTPHLFTPTAERPLRAKQHTLATDTRVAPHNHAWAQLAWSATGV